MKLAAALYLVLLAGAAQAQTASAPLEAEASSARVAAMGGAGLALDDGSAWVQDPSGLAGLNEWSLHAHEQSLPAGLQRQWLEGMSPLNGWLGLGAGLGYTSFGSLEARDEQGVLTGSFEPKRISGSLGLGSRPWRHFEFGLAVRSYQEDLGSVSFSGVVPTLSLASTWGPSWRGVLAADFDGYSSGISTRVKWLRSALLSAQGGYGIFYGAFLGFGAELPLDPIALRVGWRINDGIGGVNGLNAGLGAHWQQWSLDYAWLPMGVLGDSHRFSLSFTPQAPQATPVPTAALTPLPVPSPETAAPPLPSVDTPLAASATAAPALELEFRLPESTSDEAILADEKGGEAKALALYQAAIKEDPADTRAWMGLGHLYYRRHEIDAALQCFEQVLRLNPTETALRDWVDKVKATRVKTP